MLVAVLIFATAISVVVFMPTTKNGESFALAETSVWDGESSDTEFYTFSTNTVKIYTAAHLKAFYDLAANGYTYEGITVKLMTDVDLNGFEWYPVNNFAGIFDGNGHTIKNFVLNRVGIGHLGFFGEVSKIVTIKNLTLENVSSAAEKDQVTNNGIAILLASNTANGTQILNCTIKNAILTKWGVTSNSGGSALLVGQSTGSILIDGCSVVSSAITEATNVGSPFGGIIGRIESSHYASIIRNCSVYNTIMASYSSSGSEQGYIAGRGSNFTVSNFKSNMVGYCGKKDAITGRFDISNMGFTQQIIDSVSSPNNNEAISSNWDKLTYFNNTALFGTNAVGTYTDAPWITALNINGEDKYADVCAASGAYICSEDIDTVSISFPLAVVADISINGTTVSDTNADPKVVEFTVGNGLKQTVVNISIDGITYSSFSIVSGTIPNTDTYVDDVEYANSPTNLGYLNKTYEMGRNIGESPRFGLKLNETLPTGLYLYVNNVKLTTGEVVYLPENATTLIYALGSSIDTQQRIDVEKIDKYDQLYANNKNVYFKQNSYPWTENEGKWESGNKGIPYTNSTITFKVRNISNVSLQYWLSTQTQYTWSKDTFSITIDGKSVLSKSGKVEWTAFSQDLDPQTVHTVIIDRYKPGYYSDKSDKDSVCFKDLVFTESSGVASASAYNSVDLIHSKSSAVGNSVNGETVNVLNGDITLPDGAESLTNNVYYVNDAHFPWSFDNEKREFVSTNLYTDKATSVLTFYLYGVDKLYFDYLCSSYRYSFGAAFRINNLSDESNPIQLLEYSGAMTDFTTYVIDFGDIGNYVISIEFFCKNADSDTQNAARIKNINAGLTTEKRSLALTFNENACESVVNLYGFEFTPFQNGSFEFGWSTAIQLFATPKDGYVYAGYRLNGGALTASNGDIFNLFNDTAIELVFLPRLLIPDQKLSEFSFAYNEQGNINTDLSQIKFYQQVLINSYPANNSVSITAPELGVGETSDLYVNDVFNMHLSDDNGRYFGLLQNINQDSKISIVYKKEGYSNAEFVFTVKYHFDINSAIMAESKSTEIINDTASPFSFDLTHSSADRLAFAAGNTNIDSSSSCIKIKVKGTGVLYFDYYLSADDDDDSVLFAINNSNIKLDTRQHTILSDDGTPYGIEILPFHSGSFNTVGITQNNPYFGYIGVDYVDGKFINKSIVNGSTVKNRSKASGDIGWQQWQIGIDANLLGSEENTVYLAYCKNTINADKTDEDVFAIANIAFFEGEETLKYAVSNANTEAGSITASIDNVSAPSGTITNAGKTISLSASTSNGYQFYGWIKDNKIVSVSPNYTFTILDSSTVTAVIEPTGTYKARDGGAYYTSLSAALAAAQGDAHSYVVMIDDVATNENILIPENVTLLLPYDNFDMTGTATGTTANSTPRVSWTNENKYLYKTLTLNSGATLTVKGALIVGGIMHYPDQGAQGHTSGAYSQIINNGSIVVENGGNLTVHGLVKGDGTIIANNGSTLKQPFMVNNYAGGTNTQALYYANQFPFVQFATVNILCPQTVNYGAKVIGMTSLYFWSSITTQDVVLIDKIENQGSQGGLIWMQGGSSLNITCDDTKCISQTVGNINLTDSGLTTITVNGQITAGEFYLQGYGSGDMVLAIPYTYNFVLADDSVVNIESDRAYKIMPGASVVVNSGATLNVNGTLYVYDGLIQADKSGKFYPNSATLKANGFSSSGALVVDGTMNVNGTFAGIVQTSGANGRIVIDSNATLSATVTEGCSDGYTDNTTVFALSARAFGLADMALTSLEAGKTYVSISDKTYNLESLSMISAARVSNLTETINQPISGGFAQLSNATTMTVERTFYIGEEVVGVIINMDGNLYTTDATGKFTATLTFDTTKKIKYFTKDKDGTKTHDFTVTFGTEYDTLTEVVKSASLSPNNNYFREFNSDGTVKTDFALHSNVTFYGGKTITVPMSFADDATKYVLSASLFNAEYAVADCVQQLYTVTASVSAYIASCDAIDTAESNRLVDYAKDLYTAYTTLITNRAAEEITFINSYLAENNINNNYPSSIVKSVAVIGTVTYGDNSANATVTYLDNSTSVSTVSKVSYSLVDGILSGTFEYRGSYLDIDYIVTTTLDNVSQKRLSVTIDNKTSIFGDTLVPLTYTTADTTVEGDSLEDIIQLAKAAGTDVADYVISGTCLNAYYSIDFTNGTYSITPRDITISVQSHSDVMLSKTDHITFSVTQTNNGAAKDLTYEIKKDGVLIATVAANGAVTAVDGQTISVGTYDVHAVNHDANYNIISNTAGTFKVVEDNDYYTVEFNYGKPSGSVYDGNSISVNAVVTVTDTGTNVTDFTISLSVGTASVTQIKNAATYTVTVNITCDNINYTDTFIVDVKEISINWIAPSFSYNGGEQKPSFALDNVHDGDIVNGVYGAFDCIEAGNHTATITALSGTDSSNYKLPSSEYCSYNYNILSYSIDVAIANKTSVYGDAFVEITCSSTATLIGSDILSNIVKLTKADGLSVGNYAITGECINNNYSVSFTNGIYTISARPLHIAIDNKSSIYGEDLVALTAILSQGSLVGNDNLSNIVKLEKADGLSVGNYAITGECIDKNYSVGFTNGNYTIELRKITVTVNDAFSDYGNDDAELTAKLTAGTFVYGETIADVIEINRASGSSVGSYAITANVKNDINYDVTVLYTASDKSIYTITKRNVSINIGDITVDSTETYTTLFDKLAFSVTAGSIVGEDDLCISLAIILSSGITLSPDNFAENFAGGTHSIVGSYENNNYLVEFLDGTLTVTKPQIDVIGIETSFTYTGEDLPVFDWRTNITGYLASASANSFRATYYYGEDATEVATVKNAGTYKVVISIIHAFAYEFSADAVKEYTVIVEKKDISDAINVIGIAEGGVYASIDGITANAGIYDVLLDKVLIKDNEVITTAITLGSYLYTVVVDDANYKGIKVMAFRIVPDVADKIDVISEKLKAYNDAEGEELITALLEVRTAILDLTADDYVLIDSSADYTALINNCISAWDEYLADCAEDFELAQKAANANLAIALLTLVSAMSVSAWFSFRKFLL